ncbi:MAG: hypothetical protein M0036_14245 [Desulfobacteraceae bacterium]|nr:hypothetical protein [Desulfobacteraceae bacterium]
MLEMILPALPESSDAELMDAISSYYAAYVNQLEYKMATQVLLWWRERTAA